MSADQDLSLTELKDALDEQVAPAVIEHAFEPSEQSDVTIHFNGHAFHVHTLILIRASAYFKAALHAGTSSREPSECTLTDECSRHSCLELPDLIGGVSYSGEQMKKFLELVYDPSILLTADGLGAVVLIPSSTKCYLNPVAMTRPWRVSTWDNQVIVEELTPRRGWKTLKDGHPAINHHTAKSAYVTAMGDTSLTKFLDSFTQAIQLLQLSVVVVRV